MAEEGYQEDSYDQGVLAILSVLPQLSSLVLSCADLHDKGFTKSQFLIFAALGRRGRLRMSQVAEYLASSREQATRSIAQLVKEGYVARERDADNRTVVYVTLTDKGRTMLEGWWANFQDLMTDRLNSRLTEAERSDLIADLQNVAQTLDKVV